MKKLKVAVTGHRPERIKGQEKSIECWLNGQIKNLVACYDEVILINGMAPGVDQMAALAAIRNGAEVLCYFPYRKNLHETQKYIVDNAAEVRFMYDEYQRGCYIERDRRMVDDCDLLLVVWDGIIGGGTYYTYKYALEKGRDVLVYPGYEK